MVDFRLQYVNNMLEAMTTLPK